MKKLLWIFLILLLILGLGIAGYFYLHQPIKIGAIYNLTGSQSSLDEPSANGSRLAVSMINEQGGILGRKIKLVLYDGKSDPKVIQKAAERLINQDKVVAGIGFSDTDMVLAAAPVFAKAGKIFITSGATSPQLPDQVKGTLFLACFGDNTQAAAGAEFAFTQLHAKHAYILMDETMAYTRLLAHYFKGSFQKMGGKIVLEDSFKGGDRNFKNQLLKLKHCQPKPDVLYLASGPDDIGYLVKACRQAGIQTPIMSGDGADTPLLVEVAQSDANNVYFSSHVFLDQNLGLYYVQTFMKDYQRAYQKTPENGFTALGYDAIWVLCNAIQKAGSLSTDDLVKALQNPNNRVSGITGDIAYEKDQFIPIKSVSIIQIQQGKMSLAKLLTPTFVINRAIWNPEVRR